MTNGEIISQIRSRNFWLAEDSEVTDRTIYKIAQAKAALLIKQEFNKGRLLTSDNVFQVLECKDLILSSPIECDIPAGICSKVRKSKITLDGLGESELGYSIQGVFNIVNSREIFPTTIREFINLNKLRIKPSEIFYIIKNKHVYVLNEDVVAVNMYVYSTEDLTNSVQCNSMYDREFKFPEYLKDVLYNMIDQSIQLLHKIEIDPNDNNNQK